MAEDIKRSDLLLSLIKLEKDKGFVSLVDVIAAKKAYKEGKSYTNDDIIEALKEFDVHYTESEDGSDFDEEEPTEEETQFEGREVKNSTPQLNEEEYNQIQEKAKSLRAETDDDFTEEEEPIEEDNDIINSLLESAKDDAPVQDTIKDVKSKFSFLQKKEKNDDKSSEGDKKLSFFKKKNKEEQEKIPEETEEPETTEEIENSEDIEEPINEDSAHKEKKKHKSGGLFLKKNKGSELNDFLSNDSEDDSANADDINTVE